MTIHEERQQLERDIAERAAMIKRAETLRWCEARRSVEPVVPTSLRYGEACTTSAPESRRASQERAGDNQAMTHDITAGWQSYIAGEVRAAEQRAIDLTMEVVGETLGKLRADLRAEFKAELEAEVLKIRNEFLQDRLDEARGVKQRLRSVPPAASIG